MTGLSGQTPPLDAGGQWRLLVRSFATLAVGEAVARAFGLVAVVVLARELEPAGFGIVTLGATLVLWFALVVDSGTEVIGLREVSRAPERLRQLAGPVLGLRLVLSFAAMGALAAVALLITGSSRDRDVLLLFALVLPAIALNLRWMVLGAGASKAIAIGNGVSQLIFALGVVLLVSGSADAVDVPPAQAAGELAYGLIVMAAVARRAGVPWPRVDLPAWRSMLVESFPLMINNFARAVMLGFDLVLVALLLGTAEAGLYGAAWKPVLFLLGAIRLGSVSFLSAYSSAAPRDGHALFRRGARASLLVTVPVAIALAAGAGPFVELVFGDEYSSAATALAILVWRVPLTALAGAYSGVLIAGGRQRDLMWSNVWAAIFNIAFNVALVPVLGIEGAAAVSVASQLLVLGLNRRAVREVDVG